MVNKEGQTVCDHTGIILEDGVTLYPMYVEVKNGRVLRYISTDPVNEEAIRKPYILHNRIEYKEVAENAGNQDIRLEGKHFISRMAMDEYIKELDSK